MHSVNNIILIRINSINAATVARNIIYANVIDVENARELHENANQMLNNVISNRTLTISEAMRTWHRGMDAATSAENLALSLLINPTAVEINAIMDIKNNTVNNITTVRDNIIRLQNDNVATARQNVDDANQRLRDANDARIVRLADANREWLDAINAATSIENAALTALNI